MPPARILPRIRRAWRMSGAIPLLCALALGAAPARAVTFTVGGATDTVAVASGQSFTVDLVARGAGPPFNAFDLDVHFDPAKLTNVPLSPLTAQRGELMVYACTTNAPFHQFISAPDSVVGTLVILCSDVSVTGPGMLYHLKFTAAATDTYTQLWFGPRTAFYNGGPRVDTLVARPVVVKIGNPVLDVPPPPAAAAVELGPPAPNPARRARELAVPVRLPRAGEVELALVDAQGRRMAVRRMQLPAGSHVLSLVLPRLAPGRYVVVLRTADGGLATRPWVTLR